MMIKCLDLEKKKEKNKKLINLIDIFECAFHMFACMAQVLNFNIHACVMYASCRFE